LQQFSFIGKKKFPIATPRQWVSRENGAEEKRHSQFLRTTPAIYVHWPALVLEHAPPLAGSLLAYEAYPNS
jgi:hypothetical protein